MRIKPLLLVFILISFLASTFASPVSVLAQDPIEANQTQEDLRIRQLLDKMSPLEKVGQLMLITFEGTDTSSTSKIAQLIQDFHIGGVVLTTTKNNFSDTDPAESIRSLIASLQNLAYQKSQPSIEELTPPKNLPAYVPLYVAHTQNGQQEYSKSLLPGLTNLPSEMTMGATWSPNLVESIGQVYGIELSKLGFNLFLGPSLDLVDSGDSNRGVFTGTSSFGSDPSWVGKMGQAFVIGLHKGSENRLDVIATHFPGLGSIDRSPDFEVSTIQRNLDQLLLNELIPYMNLTNAEAPTEAHADGLMTSHIRFQGLQGNVNNNTRPISFDQVAMQLLLAQPQFSNWYDRGGFLVSASLGSPAVRNFFDPSGATFDPLSTARLAFLAGNDMLFLDNFAASAYEEQAVTIQRTISFFAQKYQEDSVFAQRVDASVARILTKKLALYGTFDHQKIIPSTETPLESPNYNQLALEVARESITMLSPTEDYFNTIIKEGPKATDYLTVFTDVRNVQPCETCNRINLLDVNAFKDTFLSLYGPKGSNQLAEHRINTYTFAQLTQFLDGASDQNAPYLNEHVRRSHWIIFNIQDLDAEYPASYALQRLLRENPSFLQDKMVLVFAYGTPFSLDSTEVSKLTAYYGLFTPSKASLELASRVLMLEARPRSALPFSLPAVAYDLKYHLTPDPNQIINLALITNQTAPDAEAPVVVTQTPVVGQDQNIPAPLFRMGEAVNIQAGPIMDRNGNIVPDGTKAQFTIQLAGESLIIAMPEAQTLNGYASIEYRVEREGIFAVTARSGEAKTSATLILTTQGGLAEIVMPTATTMPEPSVTPEPSPTPDPTPNPDANPTENPKTPSHPSGFPKLNDWLLVIMLLITGFGLSYGLALWWWKGRQWGVRAGLCTAVGGLIAYVLLGLGFPSLANAIRQSGTWFVVQMSFVGMLFGWIAALIWWLRAQVKKKRLNIPDQSQE